MFWIIFILGLLGAVALAVHTYFVREPKGRGRGLLAVLRVFSITLIILLLIDPKVNTGAPRRTGGTRVLVDASLSMSMGGAWQRALAEAQRADSDGRVLLFGSDARAVSPDSLSGFSPYSGQSRLLPALQSAAEAGAQRVVLITDGAIDDAPDVARWLPALGIDVDVRNVGGTAVTNRAISEVSAPTWAEAGKPLSLRIGARATGMRGATPVVVRQNGNAVANGSVELPDDGTGIVTLTFNANGPPEGGLVRYDVAFTSNDSIPDDDVRSIYVFVSEKPAGVAIVSFDPDWEPRFLHPVLANALGLPVRTFLHMPAGGYFRGGNGLEAGGRVDEAGVRRAVGEADLVVMLGLGASAPDWAQQAARTARRSIIFPADEGGQIPIPTSSLMEADWYVAAEVPPSPIASLLGDIAAGELPPLNSLQTAQSPADAWAPLLAGRTRRGGRSPLIVAGENGGRRWVVALGRGYWRWSFRGGAARDAYQRLWGSLAGWTVQDQAQVAGSAIRPVQRSVPRATALRWVAPGIAADSIELQLRAADGTTSRVMLNTQAGDTATSAPPAPGHYTYAVRAFAEDDEVARAAGPLTVESYSPEFIRRSSSVDPLKSAPHALTAKAAAQGRALHTYPWLYVVLVLLLCAEWILRRRWGLR